MARVDYYQIEENIKAALEASSDLSGIPVEIEREPAWNEGPSIYIYLDRRDAGIDRQSFSAGTRTVFSVQFKIWCFEYALEIPVACQRRDDLLGKVEIALMANRSMVSDSLVIQGGEFDNSAGGRQGFFSGASIEVYLDATAVT